MSTPTGKDEFTGHYAEFYRQYFEANQGVPHAADYLTQIDGRAVLCTWNTRERHLANKAGLKRRNVTNRLHQALQGQTDLFANPVYMITGRQKGTFNFVDEKVHMYQTLLRYAETEFEGTVSAQLKPGYWDQNVRLRGTHVRRNGGNAYANAAANVDPSRVSRVYIESWNEHSEGSGIFPALEGVTLEMENSGSDDWSSTDDPFEYVKTTFQLSRRFNDKKSRDASFLWHDIPEVLTAGETTTVSVVVRNNGNNLWTERKAYRLGERNPSGVFFSDGQRVFIDDLSDDVALYAGYFAGQPATFSFDITAPDSPGDYSTRFQMLQEDRVWFGDVLQLDIRVIADSRVSQPITGDVDLNGTVDFLDIGPFIEVLSSGTFQNEADCDQNGEVDFLDISAFIAILSGL